MAKTETPPPIKKAVFPVAGLGTRFLPATKVIPKEMLPVVDKPVIQYAVEEAAAAGIEKFVFITSKGKTAIADHFDQHYELYDMLEKRGKQVQLVEAKQTEIPTGSYSFVRQSEALGLGHAVWCARQVIGEEPFAVLLPDDVFMARDPVLRQMVQVYNETAGNILAVMEVPQHRTDKYGILEVGEDDGRLAEVKGMVEKPKPHLAPSTLSIVGRYILTPEVFDELDKHERGAGNEIQLTDAIARLIGRQPVHGYRFTGRRFDCGDKAGFVAANVAFALQRSDLGPIVRQEIEEVMNAKLPLD